ncbi:dTDP-4-dehydrorhamnose 3,5-epimerase [Halalkalibaculum sp. DA384]|uniref:dTDP-4-dehydrorhamnose 3,5-epimerase n=1 Tax=Halalkalibaculum sp. DA384 TaxID=3373606 RepID=UPI003754B18E
MPFTFEQLKIPDLILVTPKRFTDERGAFMETYKESAFKEYGIDYDFVQDNHSVSRKGVLRGLHYQRPPRAQGKLVRAVQGRIFDVAVDIREDSESFGEWVGMELSDQNRRMLFIPPGFAHGFCVLSEQAVVHYKTTAEYAPECEGGIRWDDEELDIDWPNKEILILSKKDNNLRPFNGISL